MRMAEATASPIPEHSAAATPIVRLRGVSRRFGGSVALRGIDLDLAAGERLALFGPNGSGKTTLLRVLAGLLPASRGTVEVCGGTYQRDGPAIRGRIGVVAHHTYLYDDLTAEENLFFYGRMYGVEQLQVRVQERLELAGLRTRARDKVRTYSKGMQQRLALARATLHDPDLLLFDEPDAGLDREAFGHLDGFLDRVRGQPRSVVMATHDHSLGLSSCARFAVLSEGRVIRAGLSEDAKASGLEGFYQDRPRAKEPKP